MVLRTLVGLLFPKQEIVVTGIIRKTPGVVGGSARVRDMRIPVWMIIDLRNQGWDDTKFEEYYPQITSADLKAVSDYYDKHKDEIDAEIIENDLA